MFSIFFYLLQVKYINIHCEWGRGGIRCSVAEENIKKKVYKHGVEGRRPDAESQVGKT